MILRWLIFSSAFLYLAHAATLSGQVELTNSQDSAARKHNYSGVVFWLQPVDRDQHIPVVSRHAEMKQQNKHFTPHVVAIQVGGTVDFPNLDPIFHNAFSKFAGQQFDIGLYPPGTSKPVSFGKPGIVQVFCNIHSTMSAIIDVVPTPWYDVTNAAGKFTIANVPPGEYQLHVYHERALPANLQFLERRITVPDGGLVLPLISITETGFVPAEHLDKHGMPYPKSTGSGTYMGGH
jgi:plastocyanin